MPNNYSRALATGAGRVVPCAAANPVQKVPKAKQNYAQGEGGDCQQVHGGQLVPDVAVSREKADDEDDG